jgi:undecaprenyl-diphosphatase
VDRQTVERWWPLGALAVIVALTVAVVAHPGPFVGEVAWIDALQHLGEPVPAAAEVVRVTTSTEACLIVLAVLGALAIARYGVRGAFVVAIAVLTMLVVQPTLKRLVDRPRPTTADVEVRAPHESMSFPSGHSMSTTAVWGMLAAHLALDGRRVWAALAALPVALTFLAGGVQGVHWPSDAVAGTLLGALAAAAGVAVLRASPGRPTR